MISSAVGSELISRIVGYITGKVFTNTSSPNLPMRIAVLGEVNTANQGTYDTNPKQITSAQEAGAEYGYGSPIHQMMRILFPPTGGGIGGIPIWVYPQAEPGGAAAKTQTVTVTGAATKNGTHTLVINGRSSIDGVSYSFNIETGDTPTDVAVKIVDVITAVLSCPATAANVAGVVTATTKWASVSAEEFNIEVNTNGDDLGLSYAVADGVAGAGVPDIATALAAFGNNWNTIVINPYGSAKFSDLEAFNGVPDPETPTGRYAGIVYKPFVALWGSTEADKDTLSAITDAAARKDQVTNVLCPAPNSPGFSWEAATNGALLFGRTMQDSPHLDIAGKTYNDMPVPSDENIGDMADYVNRDFLVKRGASTVVLKNAKYEIQDFITTYHPDGEVPPQFRYARDLTGRDWNVRYGYLLLELINVIDHTIANDNDTVTAEKVIKPKQWIGILFGYAEDLGRRAIIADVPFMQDSIEVEIDSSNPNRFNTLFNYKRSGMVIISSTTAKAGFNFGSAA